MSKKSNRRGRIESRHERDLKTLQDARLQGVSKEGFKEVIVCTVDDIRGTATESQTPREIFGAPEVSVPLDPLEQLREDTALNKHTAPEILFELIHSLKITPDQVKDAIWEGLNRARNKERL